MLNDALTNQAAGATASGATASATIASGVEATADAEIARRIAAGDRGALEALMRRYNRRLFRTARSILKDDAEAEDAVQEAYLLAYQAMGRFRGDARLSTWLVRIVANEAIGRLRRRNRAAEVIQLNGADAMIEDRESTMADEPQREPENAAMRAQTRRLLETKIDELPDAFRTVFVLRALEEMSVEEAAESLGIPPATVRTRYFRARAMLREALARELDFVLEEAFSFDGERCDRIVANVLRRADRIKGSESIERVGLD